MIDGTKPLEFAARVLFAVALTVILGAGAFIAIGFLANAW
jgi:hypothetical protein